MSQYPWPTSMPPTVFSLIDTSCMRSRTSLLSRLRPSAVSALESISHTAETMRQPLAWAAAWIGGHWY